MVQAQHGDETYGSVGDLPTAILRDVEVNTDEDPLVNELLIGEIVYGELVLERRPRLLLLFGHRRGCWIGDEEM